MAGELGKATLELDVTGFAQFEGKIEDAHASADRLEDKLKGLATVSDVTGHMLGRVEITPGQAAKSVGSVAAILEGVHGLSDEARDAARDLDDVKINESTAAESVAAGDEISENLDKIDRKANAARRSLDRVRIASGRPGVGVGAFGSGYGRVGLLGTAIGAGVLTGPAAAPALGALAGLPTLAAGAVGVVGTLVLALKGMGKAIDGDYKAYKQLQPEQQQFVMTIRSLLPWVDKLKQAAAEGLVPGLTQGLRDALSPGTVSLIQRSVGLISSTLGQAAATWGAYLGSPEFQSIFGPLMVDAARNLGVMSAAALHLFDALGVLGRAAIPLTDWIIDQVAKGSQLVDSWLHAKDASGELAHGLDEAKTSLRIVGGLLVAAARAVGALGVVLYPVAQFAVVALTHGLNALAGWLIRNEDTIRKFVGGALSDFVTALHIAGGALVVIANVVGAASGGIDSLVGPVFTARHAVVELAAAFVAVKLAGIIGGWKTALVQAGQQAVLSSKIAQGATRAEAETYVASMGTMEAATIGLGATIKSVLITTGIGALIVAAGLAAEYVITHWEKVKGWFEGFARFLPATFGAAWTAIKGIFELGIYAVLIQLELLTKGLEKALGWIPGIGGKIRNALQQVDGFIESFRERGVANMAAAGQQMGDAWGNAFSTSVQDAIDKINAQGVMKTVPMEGTLSGTHLYHPTSKANEPAPGTHAWYLKYLGYDPTSTSTSSVFGKAPPFDKNVPKAKEPKDLEVPLSLQLRQAAADASGIEAKQKAAALAIKKWAERMITSGKLTTKQHIQALELITQENTTLDTKDKQAQLEVPLRLQLQEAKANASGIESKQKAAARAIRNWARAMIKSGKLTTDELVAAYNLIAQENATLAEQVNTAAAGANEAQFLSSLQAIIGSFVPNSQPQPPEQSGKSESHLYEAVHELRTQTGHLKQIAGKGDFAEIGRQNTAAEAAIG